MNKPQFTSPHFGAIQVDPLDNLPSPDLVERIAERKGRAQQLVAKARRINEHQAYVLARLKKSKSGR